MDGSVREETAEAASSGQGTDGALLHNLLLFGRLLRSLGMDVSPRRIIDLVQALEAIEIGRREDFYHTLRAFLVHDAAHLPLFEQAFALFWRRPEVLEAEFPFPGATDDPVPPALIIPPPLEAPEGEHLPPAEADEEEQLILELLKTYNTAEQLRDKDFGELTAEELDAVRRLMASLIWDLGRRRTRRFRPGRGSRPDLRRALRRSLRYGGELLEWPRRERKLQPRPLVIIADVSGSMERYARLLLQFIYSLAAGLSQQVEAFVFSTRLTRITRQLRARDLQQALDDVAREVQDWSGGTRIGEALRRFNYDWGRRVLGRGAVVLLISDGWDRGDPELLAREMARLQRSAYRLIWLNPLLGSARYEPLTRGIQAALPYVDDFLPVHNLASLEDLAAHLIALDKPRPPSGRQLSGAAFISRQ
ncbi:MAG: VWA domain-containing protein [Candidatus Promineifilaceae bacterium]|nr:VWA domain-containing protein [Candidatus Promineifilaceae bacterium]